jgi:hypothetical protein
METTFAPVVPCVLCNTENAPIGKLGLLWHFRCRACGMGYNAR